jgi:hypothetical protein
MGMCLRWGAAALGAALLGGCDPRPPTEGMARVMCQRFIERQLNDPKSAEWVEPYRWPVKRENGRFVVAALFRAKNVFGGVVPAVRVCTLTASDDDHWQLESLE